MRVKKLKARYGVDFTKKDEAPDVITTENYVEYDRKGNVVKGMAEVSEERGANVQPVPKSKYEEDLYPGNHTSIWGSWYNREEMKWGYACCHQCVRNAYCTGEVMAEQYCLLKSLKDVCVQSMLETMHSTYTVLFRRSGEEQIEKRNMLYIVPIVVKTIREDGETNFIDVDCTEDKSLLISLIPKTTIQRSL